MTVYTTPQVLTDAQQPVQGMPGSRTMGFLRATPFVFTVISAVQSNQDFHVRAQVAHDIPQVPRFSRTSKGAGQPNAKYGEVRLPLLFTATTTLGALDADVSLLITFGMSTGGTQPSVAAELYPSPVLDVAFSTPPLSDNPAFVDISQRLRALSTNRGRSYEFDRMETGTLQTILNNRDAALSPENSLSPYAPLRSTRRTRASLTWGSTTYPLFQGINEGFPQSYPHLGYDALVEQQTNDLFYALNNSRFTPGETNLTLALSVVPQNTEEIINVVSTLLPRPQAVPFTITVAGVLPDWPTEEMEVQEILNANQYRVMRSQETTWEHPVGATVTTSTVSFAEEPSGIRIQNVLYAIGFGPSFGPSGSSEYGQGTYGTGLYGGTTVFSGWPTTIISSEWWDLEEGQSVMTASEDLASVSPLEHINLVTEAEFGRFFVSRAGKFTFRDRHSEILDHLTPDFTFRDGADTDSNEVPFVIEGALEHSDEKLYNRVRITIVGGDHAGVIVDVFDQASIDQHFERVFERQFPYANLNDAISAANFVLARSSEDTLRLPTIVVQGAKDPDNLWPLLLARELGDRCRFRYQPQAGGDEIDKDVVIEGISHKIAPKQHSTSFQCTEVDSNEYWILGTVGYSELSETTWAAF